MRFKKVDERLAGEPTALVGVQTSRFPLPRHPSNASEQNWAPRVLGMNQVTT